MSSHHFFNRNGGVSRGIFTSLNVAHGVGDDPGSVEENRRRVKEWMGGGRLISARQVHGDRVCPVRGDHHEDREAGGFDALVTSEMDTILLIQQADCQAVLLHDMHQQVIAAIHCGWRGSVSNIIAKTVALMRQQYRSSPSDINAFIGPSLGPCCAEFVHFEKELPEAFHGYQIRPAYFDFWKISMQQLIQAGLKRERIDIAQVCTSCSDDYFSYRRACRTASGITGRHCSAIRL